MKHIGWRAQFELLARKVFRCILIRFALWAKLVGELTVQISRRPIQGGGKKKRTKRCIVDKTELSVAKYFPQDKVFGLYNDNAGNGKPWTNNFKYWKMLRDEQSFPFIKNTNRKLIEDALREQPQDLARCTTKYKMAQQNEADPHKEQS